MMRAGDQRQDSPTAGFSAAMRISRREPSKFRRIRRRRDMTNLY